MPFRHNEKLYVSKKSKKKKVRRRRSKITKKNQKGGVKIIKSLVNKAINYIKPNHDLKHFNNVTNKLFNLN